MDFWRYPRSVKVVVIVHCYFIVSKLNKMVMTVVKVMMMIMMIKIAVERSCVFQITC